MKHIWFSWCILVSIFFPVSAQSQETVKLEGTRLIELEGGSGRILVFPNFLPGPKGPVIKFVVFGVYETPEVLARTPKALIPFSVTTVFFEEGNRFSGWIDAPEDEIISIWINGWLIEWEDPRWQ